MRVRALPATALLLCCLLIQSLGAQEADQRTRVWTDSTGKFKIEATFSKFQDGTVELVRTDNGTTVKLPIARFSKEDIAMIRELAKSTAAQAKSSSGATPASSPSGAPPSGAPLAGAPLTDAEPVKKAWKGTWNNRKYGTEGPMTCIVEMEDNKTWKAKFVGMGLGKPFQYNVSIIADEKGNQIQLQGNSSIDGDAYQWSGYVKENALYGRYRSASGNNGEFQLKSTQVPSAESLKQYDR